MAKVLPGFGYTVRARPSGFLKPVASHAGIGRPVKQLKRLTLNFCESHPKSRFMRKFVETKLVDFARKHPTVVIYAMPKEDADPKVCAEWLNGHEEIAELEKKDTDDILHVLETYTGRSGIPLVRIRKEFHTDCPSIQGEWNPFTNLKDYDITKPLDFKTKLHNAWDHKGQPWKKYYRKHELHKLAERQRIKGDDKFDNPLGKWGPPLEIQY